MNAYDAAEQAYKNGYADGVMAAAAPGLQTSLHRGDIIQANENVRDWAGCVLIIDEVKPWGVQAFLRIPMQGDAYIRLPFGHFELLGGCAVLMPAD